MAIMEGEKRQWGLLWVVIGGVGLCVALVLIGLRAPNLESATEISPALPGLPGLPGMPAESPGHKLHPLVELLKLVAAALMAMVVTAIHKRYHKDTQLTRSLEHAQILLCIAGTLMMIIIASSVARALGIAGAASIIRFRTPVEDPKDTVVLFLLLAMGMACGLGMFAVAGLGTVFLCIFLWVLGHLGEAKPRAMTLHMVASQPEFPSAHVDRILSAWQATFEVREVTQGKESWTRYHVLLDPAVPLAVVGDQLMAGGAGGLKSVAWEHPKKEK